MEHSSTHISHDVFRRDLREERQIERRNRRIQKVGYSIGAIVIAVEVVSIVSIAYSEGKFDAALGLVPRNEEVTALADELLDNDALAVRCDNTILDKINKELPDAKEHSVAGAVDMSDANTIYLRTEICDSLETLTEGGKATNATLSNAASASILASNIEILEHEGMHTTGVKDEAQASCYTAQHLPRALESIGFTAQSALEHAKTIALFRQNDPARYLSNECRPGGAYDLGISSVYITPPIPSP